jgi:anti-sigma B factor antagonist
LDLVCKHRASGGQTVCTVVGEIDMSTCDQLRNAALDAMRAHGPHLILDLSGVTFMDAQGISCLVRLRREAAAHGGQLTLAGVPHAVMRVLTLTHMDHAFETVIERRS